jgi:hypothetical protein
MSGEYFAHWMKKAAAERTQNSKLPNAYPPNTNRISKSALTCSRFAKANSTRAYAIATAPSKT